MERDKKGRFVKGMKPWNKGTKGIMKAWNKGKSSWSKGKHLSKKHKRKIKESNLNKKHKRTSEKFKGKGNPMYGKKPWNYIDGRSKLLPPARYGDDWEAVRYLVYLRDHFTCQECGATKIPMDVHHKIPFLISHDNSLSNLITLCRSCHRKIESQIILNLKNRR